MQHCTDELSNMFRHNKSHSYVVSVRHLAFVSTLQNKMARSRFCFVAMTKGSPHSHQNIQQTEQY